MLKKLVLIMALIGAGAVAHAETWKGVSMSTTGILQPGTTSYAMHIGSGTVDNFRCATCTVTGPLTVSGLTTLGTMTASSGTITNFIATASTITTLNGTNATFTNATITNPTLGNQTITGQTTFTGTSTTTVQGKFDFSGSSYPNFSANNMVSRPWFYQRPRLEFSSISQINVSTNDTNGTANTTIVQFHDGEVRSVTEDLSSTQLYRAFKQAQTACWAACATVQGGVDVSTAINDRRYEAYAVKVSSVGLTTKFVIVGSTVLPIPTNFSKLNTQFATNGWVPLGLMAHGNNDQKHVNMLDFVQRSDGWFVFRSSVTGNAGSSMAMQGILVAGGASGTSVTFTPTIGNAGATQIPDNADGVRYSIGTKTTTGQTIMNAAGLLNYYTDTPSSGSYMRHVENTPSDGIQATWTTAAANDVTIEALHDGALNNGSNP